MMVVVHLSVWLACKTVYVSWYLQPNPLLVKITRPLVQNVHMGRHHSMGTNDYWHTANTAYGSHSFTCNMRITFSCVSTYLPISRAEFSGTTYARRRRRASGVVVWRNGLRAGVLLRNVRKTRYRPEHASRQEQQRACCSARAVCLSVSAWRCFSNCVALHVVCGHDIADLSEGEKQTARAAQMANFQQQRTIGEASGLGRRCILWCVHTGAL